MNKKIHQHLSGANWGRDCSTNVDGKIVLCYLIIKYTMYKCNDLEHFTCKIKSYILRHSSLLWEPIGLQRFSLYRNNILAFENHNFDQKCGFVLVKHHFLINIFIFPSLKLLFNWGCKFSFAQLNFWLKMLFSYI